VYVRSIAVAGHNLRVATTHGSPDSLPLLFFNGIGANLELLHGFADEMERCGIGTVVFDVRPVIPSLMRAVTKRQHAPPAEPWPHSSVSALSPAQRSRRSGRQGTTPSRRACMGFCLFNDAALRGTDVHVENRRQGIDRRF
jgi:hypothetical protein